MPVPDFIKPMEARLAFNLPEGEGWQFEPKWDGFRCLAVKEGTNVELWAKSGKPLGRYFPEVMAMIRRVPQEHFILDGELIVPIDDVGSFDALQHRLHPAESRIRKLSVETPALLVVFDLLHEGKARWLDRALVERRKALEAFLRIVPSEGLRLSPATTDLAVAERWFAELSHELDGVIAKRLDDTYASGERAMLKLKRIRTADCVVGGFRYGTGSKQVGSLLLGLYNAEGKLDHVGFTSAFSKEEKPALTQKLERLRGGSGFDGKAPGESSRWSTERSSKWEALRLELVAEVGYDQISGDRFRHPTRFVRWRQDKPPESCTFDQLAVPVDPDTIIKSILVTA
ncbi:MAG: ATP-dependent DNA ligase [Devosia sp.]